MGQFYNYGKKHNKNGKNHNIFMRFINIFVVIYSINLEIVRFFSLKNILVVKITIHFYHWVKNKIESEKSVPKMKD